MVSVAVYCFNIIEADCHIIVERVKGRWSLEVLSGLVLSHSWRSVVALPVNAGGLPVDKRKGEKSNPRQIVIEQTSI